MKRLPQENQNVGQKQKNIQKRIFFFVCCCGLTCWYLFTEIKSFHQDLKPLLQRHLTAGEIHYEKHLTIPVRQSISTEAKCGEILPELQESSGILKNILDLIWNNPPNVPEHDIRYNQRGHKDFKDINDEGINYLLKKQSCIYDALTRWNKLSKDLGISRWAAHGGSAMGAKCYGGMNPWDDDIDITVLDCKALDDLWENGEANITSRYPTLDENSHSMNNSAAIWDSRLIADGQLILTKGSRCCRWYKLMTVQEAFNWEPGENIGGMDIECMSRHTSSREKSTMKESKFTSYMNSDQELHTVPFGSTTIQVMDPDILNRYIQLRYGKVSPCQFPFAAGVEDEKFPPVFRLSNDNKIAENPSESIFHLDQRQAQMKFAVENWYVSHSQREDWFQLRGNNKQMEYTKLLPNLDKIEIDNTISSGCSWGANATLKVIGWNAERGTHWDKFHKLIKENDDLNEPLVILLNEMDIGMARSGNVHTARRLALQLGMNYAYGVEFLELTRGTEEEQKATKGDRDALSLHGNAILTKCILGDSMILRDPLPHTYYSDKAHRGINAGGFEVRLGGRMGLFARIFEKPDPSIQIRHNMTKDLFYVPDHLPPHFVVGNVHKLQENTKNRAVLWNFYGFGAPPANSTLLYDGKGIDLAATQKGVVIQGDFGPQFCSLGGLGKKNNYRIHKTFRVECLPNGKSSIKPLAGDFFCSNMNPSRDVIVTPPCDWTNNTHPLTLADHAIVSIEVQSNKA